MRSMLREVASDGMLLRQMRQASLARAAEFSWESTARQTLALYNQLIAK